MKILIDSTLYSKKMAVELRNMAKNKFKAKKVKIETPKYIDKGKKKKCLS